MFRGKVLVGDADNLQRCKPSPMFVNTLNSRRILSVATLVAFATLGSAQTFQEYLKLRKQYKIASATSVTALDSFVGSETIEIEGIVKGSVNVKGENLLLLERADGSERLVHASVIPGWLIGNESKARLIVSVTRASAGAELNATMIGVAPSGQVSASEPRTAPSAKSGGSQRKSGKNWTLPASQVTPIYAEFIKRQNPRLSKGEATKIAKALVGFSIEYGVDARLIIAIVIAESGFDPNSTSRTGAMGLGQLMPGTASGLGVSNAYDTTENLYGCVKLIRSNLNSYRRQTGNEFESLRLSLAAYNAGAGAVSRAGGVPHYRETENYVKKVVRLYYGLCGIKA